jgi:hypothetical protein
MQFNCDESRHGPALITVTRDGVNVRAVVDFIRARENGTVRTVKYVFAPPCELVQNPNSSSARFAHAVISHANRMDDPYVAKEHFCQTEGMEPDHSLRVIPLT